MHAEKASQKTLWQVAHLSAFRPTDRRVLSISRARYFSTGLLECVGFFLIAIRRQLRNHPIQKLGDAGDHGSVCQAAILNSPQPIDRLTKVGILDPVTLNLPG